VASQAGAGLLETVRKIGLDSEPLRAVSKLTALNE